MESDDETLYQSKRSSQIKRDQHSSLPDLTESLTDGTLPTDLNQPSDHIEPSSSTSSVSTTAMLSPTSPIKIDSKRKSTPRRLESHEHLRIVLGNDRAQSASTIPSSPSLTPKSPRKMVRNTDAHAHIQSSRFFRSGHRVLLFHAISSASRCQVRYSRCRRAIEQGSTSTGHRQTHQLHLQARLADSVDLFAARRRHRCLLATVAPSSQHGQARQSEQLADTFHARTHFEHVQGKTRPLLS